MSVLKALKVEVRFLTENAQPNDQIIDWIEEAMHKFCEFYGARAKIVEIVENISHDIGQETDA